MLGAVIVNFNFTNLQMEAKACGEEENRDDHKENERNSRSQHFAGSRCRTLSESTVPKRFLQRRVRERCGDVCDCDELRDRIEFNREPRHKAQDSKPSDLCV